MITKEPANKPRVETKVGTDDLASHVGSVLRELNTVRTETKRLLDQRRQLEVYLTALKTELVTLRAEKVELMALKAEVMPHAAGAAQVDLVERARAAAKGTKPTAAPVKTESAAPAKAEATTPAPKHGPAAWTTRTDKDEDAFRAFLQADEDHDKSRAWFMSQSH